MALRICRGFLTENPEYRQRFLLVTPKAPEDGKGQVLARYSVQLDGNGSLEGYRRLAEG